MQFRAGYVRYNKVHFSAISSGRDFQVIASLCSFHQPTPLIIHIGLLEHPSQEHKDKSSEYPQRVNQLVQMLAQLALLTLASLSIASPITVPSSDLRGRRSAVWTTDLVERAIPDFSILIDISAPITYPTAGTVFTAGGPGSVSW